MMQGMWVSQGGGSYHSGPPQAPGLGDFGVSNTSVHAFTSILQGVLVAGMGADLPSPSPTTPSGRFTALSLLHLCVACGFWQEMETCLPYGCQ